MTRAKRWRETPNRRIGLLAGQAFALGLTTAWLIIPASAIFLATYGSDLLPITYIGAAIAGVVSSKSIAATLRRLPLTSVATRTLAGFSASLLASWLLLWRSNADWISFGLLVLVPIVVPVGFIFVVGQAGMLLDVRSLKALYARVVAGFALGFVAGGVAGPPLLIALGHTEHLLAAAAVAAGMFLILVALTRRNFPAELSLIEHADVDAERVTLRVLLHNRYVMLIVGFQMLSAVESQWLDFLVFDRAAQRYDDSRELARFIGRFSAIAYGTDILFLLVLAGILLRRFGLRYGLTANAAGVLALVVSVIVAASLQGSGATIVFVLVVAARVTDLVFSDGTSRTSLSAAYQVVPSRLRTVAQATVEGLAVPVAIGVSGVVLLALRFAGRIDGSVLPVLTGFVVVAWIVVAMRLYREYRVNLLGSLRGRTLDPAALSLDDATTPIVIDRLVESEDERDVALGLDILTTAQHPGLSARLQLLVADERITVRVDALERLVELDPHVAAVAARDCLDDPAAIVRATCIRVLGATADPSDVPAIVAHSTDDSPDVKVAVAATMTRVGDDAARAQVEMEVSRLSRSDASDDRITAARMLEECEPGSRMDRAALGILLADRDHDVVNAALVAIHWPDDDAWLVEVAGHLAHRQTAGAAVDAMVRGGDAVLGVVDDGFRSHELGRREQELLARVCRLIGGPSAIGVLRNHIEHSDREVGLAVMTALAAAGPGSSSPAIPHGSEREEIDLAEASVVRADLEHASHLLRALLEFQGDPSATLLCAALRDELELARRRVLAALSMRHGTEGLNRAAFQFAQRDARSHALALEWLDVTLKETERAVVAILEPGLSDRERFNALMRWFSIEPLSKRALLVELVEDRDGRWRRAWISACALHAASDWPDTELEMVAAAAERSTAFSTDDDASLVYETLAGIRHHRSDPRREEGRRQRPVP